MTKQQDMFDERYRKVLKRHRQLSRGYVTKLEKNGVITHRPNRQIRDAFSFSMIFLPIGVLFFLKACIVTLLGEEGYVQQVEVLRNGGFVEQMGALIMQIDPITAPLARLLGNVIG
ncbi:MAG: hypothetical protein ACSHXH_16535 [Marivita sp.]|uniref:hypothetical protein n=1 Tax=Marivita sp. TaxID=2003365 RepID=UPI003EF29B18